MNNSFQSIFINLKHHWKALALSGTSQMVNSLTNFVVVLYLVRVMDKSEFGFYSLGFALMLTLAGLISSSIIMQFVVNLPDIPKIQRADYAMHHSAAVFLLGMILIILGLFVNSIQTELIIGEMDLRQIILPLAIATFFYSQRDVFVRIAYSEKLEFTVLLITLFIPIGMVIFFIIQWYTEQPLTAFCAMYGIAAGQAAGCMAGLHFLKLPYKKFRVAGVYEAFKDSWQGGRWNILSNIVYSLRSQAHNLIAAPLLGAAALAEMNATRVLVTPAVMAIPPLTQILMPRLGEKRKQGVEVIKRYAFLSIGMLTAFSLLYTLLLLVLLPWVLPLALGEAYQHTGNLVMAWCLVTVFLALRNGLAMVLQVVRVFRELLTANMIAAAVAILLVIVLSMMLDNLGAIIAIAIAEVVLCFCLGKLMQSRLVKNAGPEKISLL
ncbi:MAG: hypothetical protein JNIBNLAF_01523 [Nitrosomonas europaea]|uniref:lipopolysaccharide biosynthesis protein n=1 Tax=Nitrosomonas europaea TaxID=915 RepID=UPI0023F393DC|nr:hypothetical protein [Nitrosomonas europaea]MBV6389872.1 hypothetical protein [Nitrosomonas europaea]